MDFSPRKNVVTRHSTKGIQITAREKRKSFPTIRVETSQREKPLQPLHSFYSVEEESKKCFLSLFLPIPVFFVLLYLLAVVQKWGKGPCLYNFLFLFPARGIFLAGFSSGLSRENCRGLLASRPRALSSVDLRWKKFQTFFITISLFFLSVILFRLLLGPKYTYGYDNFV